MHYVRPGAVRIGAIPSDPSFHVLAFSQNGKVTTVIDNTSGSTQTVNLSGLPPGNYGLSQAASGATSFKELGIRTVGADGTLTMTNVTGGSAVTTVYPYSGTNQPPTIEVWGASPGYLVAPTNSATLSVIANDAELDALTYRWSVTNQPAGANAVFANSNAATTVVSGLTVAGTYVFNMDVSDGVNISSKQVYLVVYASNPPPVLGQTGFRIAAPYGLVFGDPSGTTHANIELPTSVRHVAGGNFRSGEQRFHRARHLEHREPAGRSERGHQRRHGLYFCEHPRQRHQHDRARRLCFSAHRDQSRAAQPHQPNHLHREAREFRARHQFHHGHSGQRDVADEFNPTFGDDQRFDESAVAPLVVR